MTKELQRQCNHVFNKDCNTMGIRLIRFNGKAGIIKCNHTEKENAIQLLKSIKKNRIKETRSDNYCHLGNYSITCE